MKSNSLQLVAICLLALTMATACERGTRDLERWVDETLRTPGGDIPPIPPLLTPETVVYDSFELRDPFQRRVARTDEDVVDGPTGDGIRPDPDRPREFLESFPLDTFTMVGTLDMEGVTYALIRDIENVVHRVSEGNYMGTNHGRVVRVRSDRVELVELYEDARGVWLERRAQIVLPEV